MLDIVTYIWVGYYYISKIWDVRKAMQRNQMQQRQGHLGLFPLNYVASVGANLKRQKDLPGVKQIHYIWYVDPWGYPVLLYSTSNMLCLGHGGGYNL